MKTIKSWNDWFELCGEIHETVEQYENIASQLLQKFVTKKDRQSIEKEMSKYRKENLERDFHRNLGAKTRKMILALLVRKLPVLLFSFLGIAAVCLVYGLVCKEGNILAETFGGFINGIWIPALLSAFVLFILTWGISILSFVLKCKSLSKRLTSLEDDVIDSIKLIPPKYRSSFSICQIHMLWRQYDDMTFQEACASIDAHIRKNGQQTPFKAVLFDVPYENTGLGTVVESHTPATYEATEEEKTEQSSNPNLPPDIGSKTFAGSEDAEAELEEMVGMASVKEQIKRMKNRISFYGSSNAGGGSHIAFMGGPGTGKTSVARIVTRILYDFGYIKKNKCVEIDGDYLKSPYVGQTGERTAAIVQHSMGGVLFIDEAYLLYDKNNATAAEAVGVLLKAMEDNRKDFVVIFAGYSDQMNRLLNMNEGFASRIKYRIYFEDYTVDELWDIFMLFLDRYTQNEAYIVDDGAEKLIRQQFAAEKSLPHFGNARTARNALDSIMDYHADNCVAGINEKSLQHHITEADVRLWISERSTEAANDTRNFVGASDMDESIITTSELRQHDRSGVDDADKALKGFIGLNSVKQVLDDIRLQSEFYGESQSVGNMFFIGQSGTGKTSMAPVVTGYLYGLGCIRDNRYVSVTGDFLRGIYVGQTGRRVQAVVKYSLGGVLFIDEIAALCNPSSDDSFGVEALTVLQQAMGEHAGNLVVIFAGTQDEMDYLCRSNTGLAGLVGHSLHFASLSLREICMLFKKTAVANRFAVDEQVWPVFQKFYSERMQMPDFCNARDVQRFFDAVRRVHIRNYNGDADSKFAITVRDVNDVVQGGF